MDVCKDKHPELAPIVGEPDHLQACWLDQETKDREGQRILETMTGVVTS